MAEKVTDTSERKIEDVAAEKLKKEAEAKLKAGASEKAEPHKKAEKQITSGKERLMDVKSLLVSFFRSEKTTVDNQ